MGKQLSKQQKQTQCSSSSSLNSNNQTINKQKQKQHLNKKIKNIKIKTTFQNNSKYNKNNHKININIKEQSQALSFLQVLNIIQHQLISSNNRYNNTEINSNNLNKIIQNSMNMQLHPDLSRVSSFFNYFEQNLNHDQFILKKSTNNTQVLEQNKQIQIKLIQQLSLQQFNKFNTQSSQKHNSSQQKWKQSVNNIINHNKYSQKCKQIQGFLIICCILRLFFTQFTTNLFLQQIINKIGYLLTNPLKFKQFSSKLQQKCKQKCKYLSQKLQQNDLSFQFIYTGWVLGLFSTVLSQKMLIQILYQLIKSQNLQNLLQEIILTLLQSIQENLFCLKKQQKRKQCDTCPFVQINHNNTELMSQVVLNNHTFQKLINKSKLNKIIKINKTHKRQSMNKNFMSNVNIN